MNTAAVEQYEPAAYVDFLTPHKEAFTNQADDESSSYETVPEAKEITADRLLDRDS